MSKTKIGVNEVERIIETEVVGKNKFRVTDKFTNVSEYDEEGMVNYFNSIFQSNAQTVNQMKSLNIQLEHVWEQIHQNEELMEKLKPLVDKARLILAKKQKERERAGKDHVPGKGGTG